MSVPSFWGRVSVSQFHLLARETVTDLSTTSDRVGSAAVCLLSEHMTVIRQRIDMSIPRKRAGGISGHDKVSPRTLIHPPRSCYTDAV